MTPHWVFELERLAIAAYPEAAAPITVWAVDGNYLLRYAFLDTYTLKMIMRDAHDWAIVLQVNGRTADLCVRAAAAALEALCTES